MFPQSPFEFIHRTTIVDAVFGHHVGGGFIESEPTDLGCDGHAARAVAFADLQQVDGRLFNRAMRRFFMPLAVAVIANPPHLATLPKFTH